jgi:hypothetical protein
MWKMAIWLVHPQKVRFQNVRFQNVWFQNIRFTKSQVSKRPVFKFYILVKQKVYELPSLHCCSAVTGNDKDYLRLIPRVVW